MNELARATGTDGREYLTIPMEWSLDKVKNYWKRMERFTIFSDEVEKSDEGFLKVVLGLGAIWFEMIDVQSEEVIGLMYITDIVNGAGGAYSMAEWHAMLFDADANHRRPILKASVKSLFEKFGFHRLQAEIPCNLGGVIRAAKKIGFTPEGRLREARRYNGEWYDVLVLGLLVHEVNTE